MTFTEDDRNRLIHCEGLLQLLVSQVIAPERLATVTAIEPDAGDAA